MKRIIFYLSLPFVVGLVGLFVFHWQTQDFERNDYGFAKMPVVSDKMSEEEIGAYLTRYANGYSQTSDFPNTRKGIDDLKKFFLIVWMEEPSLIGDGICISADAPLYRRLRVYYPGLKQFEAGPGTEVNIRKIATYIYERRPSKLQYLLLKWHLIHEK